MIEKYILNINPFKISKTSLFVFKSLFLNWFKYSLKKMGKKIRFFKTIISALIVHRVITFNYLTT
jgi:hypothetical protein